MNPAGSCPTDPYIERRNLKETPKLAKTPTDFDKLRQFIEMDRKVLRFFCVWDNTDEMYGERRKFVLHVSLNRNYYSNDLIASIYCVVLLQCVILKSEKIEKL